MQLILVGNGELADIAQHYFERDTCVKIIGRAVERPFAAGGLMVLDDLPKYFPPNLSLCVHVAVSQPDVRRRLFEQVKGMGYQFLTYISPFAYYDCTATHGENCFIFENNVVQYKAKLGDNVVLWSGNHIGHQTEIGSHTFITSHVVISGFCKVGQNCYFGVNACVADTVKIGDNTLVGMGTVVTKALPGGKVYVGNPARELRSNVGEAGVNL